MRFHVPVYVGSFLTDIINILSYKRIFFSYWLYANMQVNKVKNKPKSTT